LVIYHVEAIDDGWDRQCAVAVKVTFLALDTELVV
jgi:hypothetical protein